MNKLLFFYTHKNYPYQDENFDHNIYWCEMILKIVDRNNNDIITLFEMEWDLRPFLDWFISNKNSLLNESFIFKDLKISLAEFFHNYYDSEIEREEEEEEKIYEYRKRHGLRFALRGTAIKDYYIGLNNGKFEVSYFDNKDSSFRFYIDLETFINDINEISNKLLFKK